MSSGIENFKLSFKHRKHFADDPSYSIIAHQEFVPQSSAQLFGSRLRKEPPPNKKFPSLVYGESIKRVIPVDPSPEYIHVNAKRALSPPSVEDKDAKLQRNGKKLIRRPEYCSTEFRFQHKRFLDPFKAENTDQVAFRPSRRPNSTNHSINENNFSLSTLEKEMGEKKRVEGINGTRNFIPVANPGDKPFREAQYEPGFCSTGGLIPGSTNTLRKSAKPTLKTSSLTMVSSKSLNSTYSEVKKKLIKNMEKNEVLSLSVPGEKQGKVVPSWEQRTGCFLVDPADEAF